MFAGRRRQGIPAPPRLPLDSVRGAGSANMTTVAACGRCGENLAESARFCPACGAQRLAEDALTPSQPGAPAAAKTPEWRPGSSSGIDHGRFQPGAMVADRYRVVALLGRGGMGEVYRADDLTVGQAVALKFLPRHATGDPDRRARLMGELRAARDVSHPNVCRVFDVGEAHGEPFISMELVHGEDLASLLRRIGRLPLDKVLDVARRLCAGLAAAHARGVLHRDLKPSNIMLDERGTVRIMDFGLAAALADLPPERVREGTPAYMAPEQLAGRAAGVASDIYALGLVLYETLTGRHAFPPAPRLELLHQREHTTPAPPSRLVEGIDDATERAVLRCLERDPGLRPASAVALAAALPGGDPLSAALAAGETPSPEMVAASGGEGTLRARVALSLSALSLALVAAVLLVSPWSNDVGVAPLPRSPEALADRARDTLARLGYPAADGDDEAWWFDRAYDYLLWQANHPDPVRRVAAWPGAFSFVFRRSPRPLAPVGHALPERDDPPPQTPGMITLDLAPSGELTGLSVVPPQVTKEGGPWPEPDWQALMQATGLVESDVSQLFSVPPRWTPPMACDSRRAWQGTIRGIGGRIEVAGFHGRPVWLAMIGPWRRTALEPGPGASGGRLRSLVVRGFGYLIPTALIVIVGSLARRNLGLGRGDRRGAFRVACVVFVSVLAAWLLSTHHVAELDGEFRLFLYSAGVGLFWATFVWLCYVALEPYLRGRWPSILIGWNRLLAGRVSDPLVGRDVLRGLVAGSLVALVMHVGNALPAWTTLRGQTPIPVNRLVLGGAADLVAFLATTVSASLIASLAILALLFLARLLVQRPALAAALTAAVMILPNLGAENVRLEAALAVVYGGGPVLVLARYGLLSLVAMTFSSQLLTRFPMTLDVSRWYAAGTLFALAVLATLLIAAFRTALGGRPALPGASLGE